MTRRIGDEAGNIVFVACFAGFVACACPPPTHGRKVEYRPEVLPMQPVALYSPEPARGWLPWVWLAPILMILFNAVPVVALDGWMQARHWSTPTGDPIGLAGLHALLWIGFAPTLLAVLHGCVSSSGDPSRPSAWPARDRRRPTCRASALAWR